MSVNAAAEPMPFRLLIDEAMKRARLHFRAVYPAIAIPLAAATGVFSIVQSSWIQDFSVSRAGNVDLSAMLQGCASFLAAALVTITLSTLGNAAMLHSCVEAVSGRPVRSGESWRFVVIPKSLWTIFLAGLAVGAGFVMLILPGLYFALMLSFVIPVLAAEGLSGSDALGRLEAGSLQPAWTVSREHGGQGLRALRRGVLPRLPGQRPGEPAVHDPPGSVDVSRRRCDRAGRPAEPHCRLAVDSSRVRRAELARLDGRQRLHQLRRRAVVLRRSAPQGGDGSRGGDCLASGRCAGG